MSQKVRAGIRATGVTLAVTAIPFALMGADCRPPWTIQEGDCTPGLMLHGVYDVRLIDTYREGTIFDLTRIPDRSRTPSCDASDGLAVGSTFRVRMTTRRRDFDTGCGFYIATVVSGIDGVDFSSAVTPGGFASFSVELTNYALIAHADRPAPFVDTPAVPGQRPPLRVTRTSTGCTDVFVAEIFRVRAIDGGVTVDAR